MKLTSIKQSSSICCFGVVFALAFWTMEPLDDTIGDTIAAPQTTNFVIGTVSEKDEIPPESSITMREKRYATQIGIGINKHYCAEPNHRTLPESSYPIGFFLCFSAELVKLKQHLQELIDTRFKQNAYLETHFFEKDMYATLYFQRPTQLNEFLAQLSEIVIFKDKATNKEFKKEKLYRMARKSYQLVTSK